MINPVVTTTPSGWTVGLEIGKPPLGLSDATDAYEVEIASGPDGAMKLRQIGYIAPCPEGDQDRLPDLRLSPFLHRARGMPPRTACFRGQSDHARSTRSASITLPHAATKSRANFASDPFWA